MPVIQFVTHTNDIDYVTKDGDGATAFVTDTSGYWEYTTMWPSATIESSSPVSPSAIESSVVSSESPESPETSNQLPAQPTSTTSAYSSPSTTEQQVTSASATVSPGPQKTTTTAGEAPDTTTSQISSSSTSSSAEATSEEPSSSSEGSTLLSSAATSVPETSSENTPQPSPSTSSDAVTPSTSLNTAQTSSSVEISSTSSITSPEPETTSSEAVTSSTTVSTTQTSSSVEIPSTSSITSSEPQTTSTSQTPSTTQESSTSTSSSQTQPTSSRALPNYIVYSPYNDNGACKDSTTVKNDLADISSKGINKIRVYATDCNSLETIQPAAKTLGMKVLQGLWIGSSGLSNLDQSLSELLSYTNDNGWDVIESIVIGNEDVTSGYVSASDLVNKARDVRSKLKAAGFSGKIMHAETTQAYLSNQELCQNDVFDVIGLNAHSFFDPNSAAGDAGSFLKGQVSQVSEKCSSNKEVFITETGYPWKGDSNGKNVPSRDNQISAIDSILKHYGEDCVILTTFDDLWKPPGDYNVEQYFGTLSWI